MTTPPREATGDGARRRAAWPVLALVCASMVGGALLWQGSQAALWTGLGCLVVVTGAFVTWCRAQALPAPRVRSHDGHQLKGAHRADGS